MLNNYLQQIVQAKWLIYADAIKAYLPIAVSYLSGNQIKLEDFKDDKKAYAVAVGMNVVDQYALDSPNLPANSVVIPVNGVITTWKSMQIESWVKQAQMNENIIAMLFITSTPGGMVVYTDILSNTIKNATIPTVDYVIGMKASAGMWALSGVKRTILSSPLDYVGSIGVMTSFTDFTKLLEDKLGISTIDMYARKSTKKNELYRILKDTSLDMEARTAGILDDLDFTNDYFHEAIRTNLGIKEDSDVFSGAIYTAQKGIDLGLAHEINPSIEYALETAYNLGILNKTNKLLTLN